jgi:hypothetical protein
MLSQNLDTIQRNAFPSQTLPDNIAGIITTFLPYVFAIVGILLLVYFILGGFSLMYAGGDPKKVQAGWAKITNAVIGLVVVFLAYWLTRLLGSVFNISIINEIFK